LVGRLGGERKQSRKMNAVPPFPRTKKPEPFCFSGGKKRRKNTRGVVSKEKKKVRKGSAGFPLCDFPEKGRGRRIALSGKMKKWNEGGRRGWRCALERREKRALGVGVIGEKKRGTKWERRVEGGGKKEKKKVSCD